MLSFIVNSLFFGFLEYCSINIACVVANILTTTLLSILLKPTCSQPRNILKNKIIIAATRIWKKKERTKYFHLTSRAFLYLGLRGRKIIWGFDGSGFEDFWPRRNIARSIIASPTKKVRKLAFFPILLFQKRSGFPSSIRYRSVNRHNHPSGSIVALKNLPLLKTILTL